MQAKENGCALRLFLNQFKSPIILILLFATGVSAVLKDWVDALIILVIVLGSAQLPAQAGAESGISHTLLDLLKIFIKTL